MNRYIHILLVSLAMTGSVVAQTRYSDDVKFEDLSPKKVNDELHINMRVVLQTLKLNANDMLILTPVLYSNNGTDRMELSPVAVVGKIRNKAVERAKRLNNHVALPSHLQSVMLFSNHMPRDIVYASITPFLGWMRDAALNVGVTVRGCADCSEDMGEVMVSQRILSEPYKPHYKLSYLVPEAEPVKARADRHSASFNYVVAKDELVRNYKNNAHELDRVDRVITEVKNNQDITITEFTISGYASPEGNYDYNRSLSDRRANSFADYLSRTHGIGRNRFNATGYGEDWDGLKEAVQNSTLADKNDILRIIDEVTDPDARDLQLKRLSHGETYRNLLENFYPPLRRTDYIIAYHVRAFNVEEAREIIKSNPKLLSLNEMYLVAQSYPVAGDAFKEVFDIAVRIYPDDPVAVINAAAAEIETGNYRAAAKRLAKMESDPRSWNNLGVAYALTGDPVKAKTYFDKAATTGDTLAATNRQELAKATQE